MGLVSADSALCNRASAGTTFAVVCTLGRAAGIVLASIHEGVLVRVGLQCGYRLMVCWHRCPAGPMVAMDDHVNKRHRQHSARPTVAVVHDVWTTHRAGPS